MSQADTCSVAACPKPHKARGWCNTHYRRWRRHGDPNSGGRKYQSPEEAFLANTEPLPWGGCVIWTGAVDRDGYGMIWSGGKMVYVHRYAWERENGPIPEGLKIDHRYHCDHACCEVPHLRLATQAENSRNLRGARRDSRTGVRNVYLMDGRYAVRIKCDGINRRYGVYGTLAEASQVAAEKRLELFGEFAGRGANTKGDSK